ncbi:MAG: dicarboxylate/amino acid:cation symporter [Legionellaceae bacterium]|nr:dicarboxylate/amino acid:cation symporter [Legionellaceae bacterium]
MSTQHTLTQSYAFPVFLIASIFLGGITGYLCGPYASYLKPFGDIFLNLIFTTIVPLIFFNVSSAIARASSLGKIRKIFSSMALVFLFTGIIAAGFMLIVVKLFPPAQGVYLTLATPHASTNHSFFNQILSIFTVSDFSQLLSHQNMLALIVFSILVGLAALSTPNEHGKLFIAFLQSGEEVFMRVFSLIMYYAPIGFFAYFAVLVNELGPALIESYARVTLIYYGAALLYFVIAYTAYAYLAGKIRGIRLLWKNIFLPMVTAIATCSSAASIPANLMATKAMQVSPEIYETSIPLGTILHKDGSALGGMVKIAFLFGIFHLNFAGPSVLLTALGVSVLVGTVMGAIPSGGMLGELLILSVYGFPPSALMAIAAISIIIDPIATMLNVTGNSVSSMMIARLVDGASWWNKQETKLAGSIRAARMSKRSC